MKIPILSALPLIIFFVIGLKVQAVQSQDEPATTEFGQTEMLLSPSQSQMKREQNGSILIYDGLMDKQVNSAMDRQFDRIESMMFIRTKKVDEITGEITEEVDDCD